MKHILVVEDSALVLKVIKHVFSQSPHIKAHYAENFAQAQLLYASSEQWFAAVVDLSLPDAPDGEIVDFMLGKNLPTIVLTGSFDEQRREHLLSKGIVDYVTKEGRFSYEYALGVLHRLLKNQHTEVLVVDDSSTSRKYVCGLLARQLYQVYEAEDGARAIKVLLENPGIKLLITDYNMPRMDGFELVKNLRVKYEKTDLVIIGISSEGEGVLSAKFIKAGANDFLKKPFNHEEFYCRISANMELLELVEQIRDAANRDELTGIYSRRYFFKKAAERFEESKQRSAPLSLGVIDLDEFMDINASYGNEVGDRVMQIVSRRLVELCDRFIVARAGGQEFYLLLPGLPNDKAKAFVEKVRQIIAAETLELDGHNIALTFSAGVSSQGGDSLDQLISNAEKCLLRAKEAGGDLVFGDE